MIPSQRIDKVSPLKSRFFLRFGGCTIRLCVLIAVTRVSFVITPVRAEVNPVSLVDDVIDLGVEIMEEVPGLHILRRCLDERPCKDIRIGAPARHQEGCLVFDDWSLKGKLCCNNSN